MFACEKVHHITILLFVNVQCKYIAYLFERKVPILTSTILLGNVKICQKQHILFTQKLNKYVPFDKFCVLNSSLSLQYGASSVCGWTG
jgi:hypothetical protein